jgi:hypothetical protein
LNCALSQVIQVAIFSDVLGPFEESFQWLLKFSSEPVMLNIKGKVVGPHFQLDVDDLQYGIVSYGFR